MPPLDHAQVTLTGRAKSLGIYFYIIDLYIIFMNTLLFSSTKKMPLPGQGKGQAFGVMYSFIAPCDPCKLCGSIKDGCNNTTLWQKSNHLPPHNMFPTWFGNFTNPLA